MAPVTKLTPEVAAAIVKALRDGDSRENAAMAAGVYARTLRTWMHRGANGEEPYQTFAHDVHVALAYARQTCIQDIRASRDWKARAWWAERVHADSFGPTLRVQFSDSVATFLDAMEEEFADGTEMISGAAVLERIYRRAGMAFGATPSPSEAGGEDPGEPGEPAP